MPERSKGTREDIIEKNGTMKSLSYSFYLGFHPFKGFYDLKHEGMGSMAAATVLLVLLNIVTMLSKRFTAYLFRTTP
ncbi:MAG: hypothetical protein FWE68_06565, partial [Defluviitaleaceae bacterium]|nr:hypothetical protein [Defluviitaleaceae bacterium]